MRDIRPNQLSFAARDRRPLVAAFGLMTAVAVGVIVLMAVTSDGPAPVTKMYLLPWMIATGLSFFRYRANSVTSWNASSGSI
jgi:membrane protein CcdC involved in cytochrome C biogenesis